MSTTHTNPSPAAFCQNCGRPLAAGEARLADGRVFCDPCLAARSAAGAPGPTYDPAAAAPPPYGYPPMPNHLPNPAVAGVLGLIPGVGAMYNGQFVKGLVHVLIFIGLISATTHFGLFGLLLAGWVFYQVFDAVQTANAIRLGMPLPDPLGLNSIGTRLGFPQSHPGWPAPPAAPAVAAQPDPAAAAAEAGAPGSVSLVAGGSPGYVPPAEPGPVPPPAYPPFPPPASRRAVPVGAVVLIALGAIFLLNTFDVFDVDWLGRGWPVLLIGLGIWLFYRNTRRIPGGPQ